MKSRTVSERHSAMESSHIASTYVNEKRVNMMNSPSVSLEEEVSTSSVSKSGGCDQRRCMTKGIEVVHVASGSIS